MKEALTESKKLMPRSQSDYAPDYERWFKVNGQITRFTGYAFFGNAEKSKAAAKAIRAKFKTPCRSIKIPGAGVGYGTTSGYVDRWAVFTTFGKPWENRFPDGFRDFVAGLEGYDTTD